MSSRFWRHSADSRMSQYSSELNHAKLKQRSRTHRRVEVVGVLEGQMVQGRPDLLWSPCGNPRCTSRTCLDAPFNRHTVQFTNRVNNSVSALDYIWQTVDLLGDVIWPGATTCADKISRQMIMGSFFDSPPIKSAYCSFRDGTSRARIKIARKSIQAAIYKASPFVERLISVDDLTENHDLICWYLGPSFDQHIEQLTLEDVVVRYMLQCETWRRFPSERRETWQFGTPKMLCDLYGGILLSMRSLEFFKLIVRARIVSSDFRNHTWSQWMQKYPLCAMMTNPYVDDGLLLRSACRPDNVPGRTEAQVLEEVGYLGGVGTCSSTVRRKVTRFGADISLMNIM